MVVKLFTPAFDCLILMIALSAVGYNVQFKSPFCRIVIKNGGFTVVFCKTAR